jgi:hypothetical protein
LRDARGKWERGDGFPSIISIRESHEAACLRERPGLKVYFLVCLSESGGEGGIRTHGGNYPTPVFKTGAINHSTTSPDAFVFVELEVILSYPWRLGKGKLGWV